MHEIGIGRDALQVGRENMEGREDSRVAEIVMTVGELSLVIPKYLEEVYPYVVEDDPMFKDTKLVIEVEPGLAECEDCDEVYNLIENEGVCPRCGSKAKTVYTGKECLIKELHIVPRSENS